MPRSATDVAREIVSEGIDCDHAFDEFVRRVEAEGLRFCPLAEELILGNCPPSEEPPNPEEPPPLPEAAAPEGPGGPCVAVANGLAEAADRDEIELRDEVVELIRLVLAGSDAVGLANTLAERDQRGEIELTDPELSLVRCLLGPEEAAAPAKPAEKFFQAENRYNQEGLGWGMFGLYFTAQEAIDDERAWFLAHTARADPPGHQIRVIDIRDGSVVAFELV